MRRLLYTVGSTPPLPVRTADGRFVGCYTAPLPRRDYCGGEVVIHTLESLDELPVTHRIPLKRFNLCQKSPHSILRYEEDAMVVDLPLPWYLTKRVRRYPDDPMCAEEWRWRRDSAALETKLSGPKSD